MTCAREFSKSVDGVGAGLSSENKSTRAAAGLAGSGALTGADVGVGRGWAMV